MAKDVYQEVTNRILELLDRGTAPWRQPIRKQGGGGWPKSLNTKKPYRGINVFLLHMTACLEDFRSDYWLTFKQAKARGGQVRKGEKSSLCVFWKQYNTKDKKTGDEVTIPVLRHYRVFNADQVDGIEPPDAASSEDTPSPFAPIEQAEKIVAGFANPPEIEHRGAQACYIHAVDRVEIAAPERFDSPESYYATLFHELSHATGAEKRLNRDIGSGPSPFGSPDYSKEELVAEMGAAFLAATAGISPPTIEQSAAYIDGWRKQLRGDKQLVVKAAGLGQRAADHILGVTFDNAATISSTEANPARSEAAGPSELGPVADRS